MKRHQSISQGHKGFVILFVVLIAAIILLIGAGIFTISFKENILSSTAKESQMAFSAADAGIECALYNDIKLLAFSLTTTSIDCAGDTLPIQSTSPDVFEFDVPFDAISSISGGNLPCAHVAVDKNYFNPTDAQYYTHIISRGYNVCDSNHQPVVVDPLLLERVLDVKYVNAAPSSLSTTTAPSITIGSTTVPADTLQSTRVLTPEASTSRASSSVITP